MENDSASLVPKNEMPVEEIDEEDDSDENGENGEGMALKFSSPQAGAERLSKLPENVRQALEFVNIETTFKAFMTELQSRCEECNQCLNPTDAEKQMYKSMWLKCTLIKCQKFFSRNLQSGATHTRIPTALSEYFKNASVPELLQTFIDVSQQHGYHAKCKHDEMLGSDKTQRKRLDEANMERIKTKALYKNFVGLYKQCVGQDTRRNKPHKFVNKNTHNNVEQNNNGGFRYQHHDNSGYVPRQQIHDNMGYAPRQQTHDNTGHAPRQQTHGKKPYYPGSYHNNNNHGKSVRWEDQQPQQTYQFQSLQERDGGFRKFRPVAQAYN